MKPAERKRCRQHRRSPLWLPIPERPPGTRPGSDRFTTVLFSREMLRTALRCVALLSATALLAGAQCAAMCLAEPSAHGTHAGEGQGHHNGSQHEHSDGSSAPKPDHQGSGSPCAEHVSHVFAVERSNLEFAPAMTAFYALATSTTDLIPTPTFSAPSAKAHPPPGASDSGAFTTVLRI